VISALTDTNNEIIPELVGISQLDVYGWLTPILLRFEIRRLFFK
jgi:hypothetical protein